jgi:hypothetical protein
LYMIIQWTFLPSLVQIFLWFQKKRWKCEIPIGSNVKLSRVLVAPNLPEMFTGWSSIRFVFLVLIWNPTWLPGSIMCSHWLKFKKIFLSETTKSIELDLHMLGGLGVWPPKKIFNIYMQNPAFWVCFECMRCANIVSKKCI